MDTKDGWRAAKVRCSVCTHEWVAVFPAEAEDDELECPSCGRKASEVVEA